MTHRREVSSGHLGARLPRWQTKERLVQGTSGKRHMIEINSCASEDTCPRIPILTSRQSIVITPDTAILEPFPPTQ